jgi:hypothetical protein
VLSYKTVGKSVLSFLQAKAETDRLQAIAVEVENAYLMVHPGA